MKEERDHLNFEKKSSNKIKLLILKFNNKLSSYPRYTKTFIYSFFWALVTAIIGLLITYFVDDFHHSYAIYVPFIIFGIIFIITFLIDFIQFKNEF